MKIFVKCLILIICFCVAGCTAVVGIPDYIKDVHPYKNKYYADYDTTLRTVRETLSDNGWIIVREVDPAQFEASKKLADPNGRQILIFTQQQRGKSTSNSTLINAYVRTINAESTEVELRYFNLSSIPFKKFETYKNDKLIQSIFESIENTIHR